jgi:hypothetical protein
MNHLFTDDNPETTVKGLKFKTLDDTKQSIQFIEFYFNQLRRNQKENESTPDNVLPKKILKTKNEIITYYEQQKMYRIIGLLNRAKSIYKKYPNDELEKSIKLLEEWMQKYKNKINNSNAKPKQLNSYYIKKIDNN